MDGITSAAIVGKKFPNADIKFMGCQYGDNSSTKIRGQSFDKVIIVDFSFGKDAVDKNIRPALVRKNGELIWIDHHKTAMNKHKELWEDKSILGFRDLEMAGCELAWKYFFPNKEAPAVVKYVGDRDMWEFKYGETTKLFSEGLHSLTKYPYDEIWKSLLDNDKEQMGHLYDIGRILTEAKKHRIQKSFSSGKEIMFEGHRCIAINTNHDTSDVGEFGYKDNDYPIVAIWSYRAGSFINVSLRSKTVNVREIAEKYGGGGHDLAAAFSIDAKDLTVVLNGL